MSEPHGQAPRVTSSSGVCVCAVTQPQTWGSSGTRRLFGEQSLVSSSVSPSQMRGREGPLSGTWSSLDAARATHLVLSTAPRALSEFRVETKVQRTVKSPKARSGAGLGGSGLGPSPCIKDRAPHRAWFEGRTPPVSSLAHSHLFLVPSDEHPLLPLPLLCDHHFAPFAQWI